ncbi:GGDEF domain-containing protein [Pseudomonas viridiflava]|uniref:putative bifunctional diguanylate cyclase/phosphodiesterase n=1 Tax=Pseudomonas viridiflava TaxID=33069 RepID=UPI0018E61EF9|nr:bifunctional diguanylate cyclase/phosphodiesterase [Pseudomonas viridiflava]MBI6727528.1 GGDEF domain-containing protein [Pseudomonas viridiflava]
MLKYDAGKILDFVCRSTAHAFGQPYFDRLVRAVSVSMGWDYVFISLINEEATAVHTIARSHQGSPIYNFEYILQGTASAKALSEGIYLVSKGLQDEFADCEVILESGARSFIGITICDSDRRPIGILGGLSLGDLSDEKAKVSLQIFSLYAARIESELCHAKSTDDLQRLAHVDFLTKLPNRHAFENRLTEVLENSVLENDLYALIMIDLDRFKQLNDHCGHQVGDEALQQLSSSMSSVLTEGDAIYRIGGDEFAVIVRRHESIDTADIAVRIMDEIDGFCVLRCGRDFKLGASMGIVNIDPVLGDRERIFKLADSACCIAKERGRGRIEIAELNRESISAHINRAEWPFRIKRALAENRFFLVGQPIHNLKADDGIKRIEILTRMIDDDGAEISPGEFIPAAERYGLMVSVDRWVLVNAMDWLANCRVPNVKISINISNISMRDDGFRSFLLKTLRKYDHLASKILFELTETSAFSDAESVIGFMYQIRALGAEFAMDDFGNGFSNYSMLSKLPISVLKIDGSFIHDILDDPVKQVIVSSFAKVAQAMKLGVVAEFVENSDTVAWLKEHGIDLAQGYFFSPPLRLSAFEHNDGQRQSA